MQFLKMQGYTEVIQEEESMEIKTFNDSQVESSEKDGTELGSIFPNDTQASSNNKESTTD